MARRKLSLALLVALLAAPVPIGLAITDDAPPKGPIDVTLAEAADRAGCRLTEFESGRPSNPPVTGEVDERITAEDGSYVGRRSPSTLASVHALLHGRVLFQFSPRLPADQVDALDRLVREDSDEVLLFANRTGMPEPVAATAYLTLMTCPRVDEGTVRAPRAFRDRRRSFGQGF
jgi:hypothetical protein